jgi:uncharacterized membrane protein
LAERAGYLQGLQAGKLRDLATEHDLLVRVLVEMGSYPLPGAAVMHVWPRAKVDEKLAHAMAGTLIQGFERTPHQDLKHGLTELMDIALKGLSPSINDPTTALNALQRTAQILHEMAWRTPGDLVERDDEGRPRVLIRRPQLADAVELSFRQVRHFGAGNPSFATAMLEVLGELAALSPERVRGVFVEEARGVIAAARDRITDERDLEQVEQAAARAIERSREPPPTRRPHALG